MFKVNIAVERAAADTVMSGMQREELAALFTAHCERQLKIDRLVGLANGAATRWLQPLDKLLRRRFGGEGAALGAALCAGSGEVTSAEHGYAADTLGDHHCRSVRRASGLVQTPQGPIFQPQLTGDN